MACRVWRNLVEHMLCQPRLDLLQLRTRYRDHPRSTGPLADAEGPVGGLPSISGNNTPQMFVGDTCSICKMAQREQDGQDRLPPPHARGLSDGLLENIVIAATAQAFSQEALRRPRHQLLRLRLRRYAPV